MIINGQGIKYDDIYKMLELGEIAGNNGNSELSMIMFEEAYNLFLAHPDHNNSTYEEEIVSWNIFHDMGICHTNNYEKEKALSCFNKAIESTSMGALKEKSLKCIDLVNEKM